MIGALLLAYIIGVTPLLGPPCEPDPDLTGLVQDLEDIELEDAGERRDLVDGILVIKELVIHSQTRCDRINNLIEIIHKMNEFAELKVHETVAQDKQLALLEVDRDNWKQAFEKLEKERCPRTWFVPTVGPCGQYSDGKVTASAACISYGFRLDTIFQKK